MSAGEQSYERIDTNPKGVMINPVTTKPVSYCHDRTCPNCGRDKADVLTEYSGFICKCPECHNVFAAKRVRLYEGKSAGNYGFASLK